MLVFMEPAGPGRHREHLRRPVETGTGATAQARAHIRRRPGHIVQIWKLRTRRGKTELTDLVRTVRGRGERREFKHLVTKAEQVGRLRQALGRDR